MVDRITLDYNLSLKKFIMTIRDSNKDGAKVSGYLLEPDEIKKLESSILECLKLAQSRPDIDVFDVHKMKEQRKGTDHSKVTISSKLYQSFKGLEVENKRLGKENEILKNSLARLKQNNSNLKDTLSEAGKTHRHAIFPFTLFHGHANAK